MVSGLRQTLAWPSRSRSSLVSSPVRSVSRMSAAPSSTASSSASSRARGRRRSSWCSRARARSLRAVSRNSVRPPRRRASTNSISRGGPPIARATKVRSSCGRARRAARRRNSRRSSLPVNGGSSIRTSSRSAPHGPVPARRRAPQRCRSARRGQPAEAAGAPAGGRIGAPGPGIRVRFRVSPPRRRVTPGGRYPTRYIAGPDHHHHLGNVECRASVRKGLPLTRALWVEESRPRVRRSARMSGELIRGRRCGWRARRW